MWECNAAVIQATRTRRDKSYVTSWRAYEEFIFRMAHDAY